MGITHSWNGTVLTVTSDSGTSSCDLRGEKGDTGIRGPQGPAGTLLDNSGMLASLNTLKGNKYNASVIAIDDLSPICKDLSINLKTQDTTINLNEVPVNLYGKNLLEVKNVTYWGGDKLTVAQLNADGSITFQGSGSSSFNYSISYNKLPKLPAGRYIFSCSNKNLNAMAVVLHSNGQQMVYTNKSFEFKDGDTLQHFQIRPKANSFSIDDTVYLQLEANVIATEYEPYVAPTTVYANAEGAIENLELPHSNTTLAIETPGVTMDVAYERDITKAFAELEQMIISIGGLV